MITGHLKDTSPLRAIFPNGIVPLMSPTSEAAHLGDAKLTENVYMIAVSQLTTEQKQAMAARMQEMGQGAYEEALADIEKATEVPVRAFHFSAVGMTLRAFI
jgi:hypothetical protein